MAKKKIVRAELYVNYFNEEKVINCCNIINSWIDDLALDIRYDCFEGSFGDSNDSLTCFNVECEGLRFSDSENLYKLFTNKIKSLFNEKPYEVIKMKLERVI